MTKQLKALLAGFATVAVVGTAVAQGTPPTTNKADPATGAGQQSSQQTPMGTTGVQPSGNATATSGASGTTGSSSTMGASGSTGSTSGSASTGSTASTPSTSGSTSGSSSTMGAGSTDTSASGGTGGRTARADRN